MQEQRLVCLSRLALVEGGLVSGKKTVPQRDSRNLEVNHRFFNKTIVVQSFYLDPMDSNLHSFSGCNKLCCENFT